MPRPTAQLPRISAAQARRLLLGGQQLLAPPSRATVDSVYRLVEQLGYVQIDSINVVERAHNLILGTRLTGFRPSQLQALLERQHRLFEGWTHDASAIPTIWFPHWRHRFERVRRAIPEKKWWRERMGPEAMAVVARVRRNVELHGPVRARDVGAEPGEVDGGEEPARRTAASTSWWGWSPDKAALEYLWWTGEVSIAGRSGFNKLYDLTQRVYPEAAGMPAPAEAETIDWSCRAALERLGAATAEELAGFWKAVPSTAARAWCQAAAARGEIAAVTVEPAAAAGTPRAAFAVLDWAERARREPASPTSIRLLCPFDPVVRDRARMQRLFDFDFRFEAFVPRDRRQHGYYTMPALEGDRMVARLDPKLHRAQRRLEIRSVTWERGVRLHRRRLAALDTAVGRLARLVGAERWELPTESAGQKNQGRSEPNRPSLG